jgi:hypothetical protein
MEDKERREKGLVESIALNCPIGLRDGRISYRVKKGGTYEKNKRFVHSHDGKFNDVHRVFTGAGPI